MHVAWLHVFPETNRHVTIFFFLRLEPTLRQVRYKSSPLDGTNTLDNVAWGLRSLDMRDPCTSWIQFLFIKQFERNQIRWLECQEGIPRHVPPVGSPADDPRHAGRPSKCNLGVFSFSFLIFCWPLPALGASSWVRLPAAKSSFVLPLAFSFP